MSSLMTFRPSRRRRGERPPSFGRSLFEWLVIILLWSASMVGVILFGAVRNWSAGGLMVPVFIGLALFALRYVFNRDSKALKLPPGGLLFLLFALYTGLLIPFAAVPYEAKVELLKILSYAGAYFVWTELASQYGRWRLILFMPLLLGTLVALYALIMHVQGSNAVLNLERVHYPNRASGTFMAPAHFGAYMGMLIPFALALLWTPTSGPLLRLFSAYGLLLFVPGLLLSGSRSGWVGAFLGVATVVVLLAWRRSQRTALIACVTFPLLSAGIFGALWHTSDMFQERAGAAIRIEGTAAWRLQAWQDTWQMIQDAPVLGHGPGSYRWLYSPYQSWSGDRWLRYAHNEYLHLWAEYGVVGLLLLGAFILFVLVRSVRLFFKAEYSREAGVMAGFLGALMAALGHGIFDFNFHVFSLMHLLVLMGGVAMAGCYRAGMLSTRSFPRLAGVLVGGVVAVFSLLAAAISFQVSASGTLTRLAEDKVDEINVRSPNLYDEAIRLNTRAMRLDPSNWVPYLQLGDIERRRVAWIIVPEVRQQRAESAMAYYQKAYQRNPYDVLVLFGIARSWMYLGDDEKALEYYRRAHTHFPNGVFYGQHLGLHLRRMGKYEEALEVLQETRRLAWRDPVIVSNILDLQKILSERDARNN